MRNIFLILLIFVFAKIDGQSVYYVAPSGGSDSNAGTNISEPWATWQHAFDVADAGDTVYFRGGVWQPTLTPVLNPSTGHGNNGTYANPICFFNYPGESPVLSCDLYAYTGDKEAIHVENATYIKFRGLTIRNCRQIVNYQWIAGFVAYNNGNIYFDNVTVTRIGGYGFWTGESDTLSFINCDSHHNQDTLGNPPYGRADGYQISMGATDTTKYLYMYGCRAWENGDDGFEVSAGHSINISYCWAFGNGIGEYGAGAAYKFQGAYVRTTSKRKVHHNIAANEKQGYGGGFTHQNMTNELYGAVGEFTNNSIFNGGLGFSDDNGTFNCSTGYANTVLRNNLVYHRMNPEYYQAYLVLCINYDPYDAGYAHLSHNTFSAKTTYPWFIVNDTITVSDEDFLSVDTTGLSAARQSDGTLPSTNFMRLAPGSDLIDAGTDAGLNYAGTAPDIGWDEYDGDIDSIATDILTFTLTDQTGAATINTMTHTVAIEVAYTADITSLIPTITLSYGATVIPASGTARDFTNPVPYTVTALDGVTHQEWTVTVTQEAEPVTPVPTGGAIVKFNGKIVKR